MLRRRGQSRLRCWKKLRDACGSRSTNRGEQRGMDQWIILRLHERPLPRFSIPALLEHFIFTQNATDSLNLLIHGFAKKRGMPFHAITTDLEHNSVLRPLTALEQDGIIRLTVVPFTGTRVNLAAIKKAIREDTYLVVMTHGSNVIGSVQDIRPIAEYLHANEIFFIVDGAQTPGHIPVYLSDIPVGAYVFTGHKALFGIPGIWRVLHLGTGSVAITRQGGTGTDSRTLTHPIEMPGAVRGRDPQLSRHCIALYRDTVHHRDRPGGN